MFYRFVPISQFFRPLTISRIIVYAMLCFGHVVIIRKWEIESAMRMNQFSN